MRVTRLVCSGCGLSYDGATLPQFLLGASGASCPRCGAVLKEPGGPPQRRARRGRPSRFARHQAAVRQTLTFADEAAADGDHRTALAWLATIEAVDGVLPPGAERKRLAWAAAADRLASGR
jgi:hypothetical protein